MKTYRPKALIPGYKLDAEKDAQYIAVPKQKLTEACVVEYSGRVQIIKREDRPVKEISFPNKFGPGEYTLAYFKWSPEGEQVALL